MGLEEDCKSKWEAEGRVWEWVVGGNRQMEGKRQEEGGRWEGAGGWRQVGADVHPNTRVRGVRRDPPRSGAFTGERQVTAS